MAGIVEQTFSKDHKVSLEGIFSSQVRACGTGVPRSRADGDSEVMEETYDNSEELC